MEEKKILLLDMYGVIIKESKGKLIDYAVDCLGENNRERIQNIIREEQYHTRAALGEISSTDFLSYLGFSNPYESMKDYIENYLTLDERFISFAEINYQKVDFVLLSNDVLEWSNYLMDYHNLNKYFKKKIISGDVHLRKPDIQIFEKSINMLKSNPNDIVFVDNSVNNLLSAEKMGIRTILFNRDNHVFNGNIVYDFEELNVILNKAFINK